MAVDLAKVLSPASADIAGALRALVADLTGATAYPGPNPVSLDAAALPQLAEGRYWACEKTHGTRAALVCTTMPRPFGTCCVLMDRALKAFWLPCSAMPTALFQNTVLDGEVVLAESGDLEYHAFDALVVSGALVTARPFSGRVHAAHVALGAYRRGPGEIGVRLKKFFGAEDADCLRAHLAALRVPRDGLVFTPERGPVQYGRHWKMFKLKPPGTHTVDFLVGSDGLDLAVWDHAARAHAPVARLTRPSPPGAVVECVFRDGEWSAVQVRADKTQANDGLTYSKTLLNARENLSEADVLAAWARGPK